MSAIYTSKEDIINPLFDTLRSHSTFDNSRHTPLPAQNRSVDAETYEYQQTRLKTTDTVALPVSLVHEFSNKRRNEESGTL